MTEAGFLLLKSRVLSDLGKRLSPKLTYHCPSHTEDVLYHTERIAISERITDSRSLLLLKIAALFHDTGFIDTYRGHEERSCEIMRETLRSSGFDRSELEAIGDMILATRVPQMPAALEQMVLCDADLDYLGREDFPVINKRLKSELLAFGLIRDEDEWHALQINFLDKHRYFTESSLIHRNPLKQKHLEVLRQDMAKRIY